MRKLQTFYVAKLNHFLNLPATHFASINHINALSVWSLILRATDFYLRL